LLALIIGWVAGSYSQQDLIRRDNTILIALEDAGYVQLARNARGEITGGRIVHLQGGGVSESFATGTLTDAPRSTVKQQAPAQAKDK
jgi:hypothetical protein